MNRQELIERKGYIHHRTNPRMQCHVCGEWKRLHGKKDGRITQLFHSCCEVNGQVIEHKQNTCDECCSAGKCENKTNVINSQSTI